MPAPVLATPQANAALTEGDAYAANVLANFTDADKTDALTFSISGLPAGTGLSIDEDTGVVSGTPTAADTAAAPFTATITATDGAANSNTVLLDFTNAAVVSALRSASYAISSGTDWEDSAKREKASKLGVLVVNLWRNWSSASFADAGELIADIRARAFTNDNSGIQIYNYNVAMEETEPVTGARSDVYTKLGAETGPTGNGGAWAPNDWWARDSSGARTSWFSGHDQTNITRFVTPDSGGLYFSQWRANRDYTEKFAGGDFDGGFYDNFFYKPRAQADWDRSGSNMSNTAAGQYIRQGNVDYVDKLLAVAPAGFKVMGNVDGSTDGTEGYLQETEHQSALPTALLERHGRLWKFASWKTVYDSYVSTIEGTTERVCVFHEDGSQHVPLDNENYQQVRHLICTTWLHDGVVAITPSSSSEGLSDGLPRGQLNDLLYDEYDIDLGAPIDAPPTAAWQNGVWKREYANALVLCNPYDNGAQTVDVSSVGGGLWKSFLGTQDATTNNGANKTSVSLAANAAAWYGDGIVLVRQ